MSGKMVMAGGSAGPSSSGALQPTVPRRPVVVPSSSRASARAQRRIQASAARQRTSSEVLLLTSKAFPPTQYQELLTFLKGLHLPPDATSLFTTVRNDQFANKKALVSSSSKEVDEVLGRYGGDWALLSLCADELGLGGGARQGPGSPSPGQRSREGNGPSAGVEAGRPGSSGQAPPRFSGAEWRFSGDFDVPALSQKWAERPPRTDGVVRRAGGGGYSLSVEALGVPVFVCDEQGRVAEWNPCLATLTGTEADECLGKPLAGRVDPEQADLVRQLFASPAESEAVLRMICADGSQLSISFALAHYDVDDAAATAATATPAAPAATTATTAAAAAAAAVSAAAAAATAAVRRGSAAAAEPSPPRRGVLGVGKDVSTLATAVAAATQEVHDLKRLIDGANAPIFGINAASLITEWNRKATAITGRSKWEVVGRRLEEFINPEDRESVVEVLENALRGKETANFGFPLYTKAGDRVEILLNASTRRDAHGNICGVISVGQDITELMRGKKELASVANDLRMLIESANAPIFGVDNAGRVTEWNSKASHST